MGFLRALDPRRILLIAGTVLVAFFCGHLMQTGTFGETAIRDDNFQAGPVLEEGARVPALPVPPAATLTPLELPPPPAPPRIESNDALIDSAFPSDRGFSPYGLECGEVFDVSPGPDATLQLHFSAPCRPFADLRVRHDTLSFSGQTDAFGLFRISVPAMAYDAEVTLTLSDGTSLASRRVVSTIEDYRRIALLWTGPQHLSMRLEGAAGAAGELISLGNEVSGAQVLSLPRVKGVSTGLIRVVLDADITDQTCGQFLRARTIQAGAIGGAMVRDVTFEMPDCAQAGGTVSFEGAFRDLRIATR